MWFLWLFGNHIEDSMTRPRFVTFYLLCGFAAAGLQVVTEPSSGVPMVGASGAISGVMGGYPGRYWKDQFLRSGRGGCRRSGPWSSKGGIERILTDEPHQRAFRTATPGRSVRHVTPISRAAVASGGRDGTRCGSVG